MVIECFDTVVWMSGRDSVCKKPGTSNPEDTSLEELWGSCLTWSNLWKTRPVKNQKWKTAAAAAA